MSIPSLTIRSASAAPSHCPPFPQSKEPTWKRILSYFLTVGWPFCYSDSEKFKSISFEKQLTSISSPLSLFRTMGSISQAFKQDMDIPSNIGGLN